jgi:hypothetical protein
VEAANSRMNSCVMLIYLGGDEIGFNSLLAHFMDGLSHLLHGSHIAIDGFLFALDVVGYLNASFDVIVAGFNGVHPVDSELHKVFLNFEFGVHDCIF